MLDHPPGPPGAALLRVRLGGGKPPPGPDPERAGAGEGQSGGPHGGAPSDLFQPGVSEKRPVPRGDLCVLRPGGGAGPGADHGQSCVRAGGGGQVHRPHYASISPDCGRIQPFDGRPCPAGGGGVRAGAGGNFARTPAPDLWPVPGGVRLSQYPFSQRL